MRTEATKDGRKKLWISRDEYKELQRYGGKEKSWTCELAVRVGGECGLRVGEIEGVQFGDVQRVGDGETYFLSVGGAKDTTGEFEEGKSRETFLPSSLYRDLYRYVQSEDIKLEEDIFPSKRTIQRWMSELGRAMVSKTGQADWQFLKPHDLRRYWAHYHLSERGVNPRVMMEVGGWSSFSAIQPYLNKPTESTIISEMEVGE